MSTTQLRELSNSNPDGTRLGQGATDKVSFFGATPIVQPTAAGQSQVTAAVTLVGAVVLLMAIRTVLVDLGLMKGS